MSAPFACIALDDGPDAEECAYCFTRDFSPNVEAWEQFDLLVCEDCADSAFEDNDQFGVGA